MSFDEMCYLRTVHILHRVACQAVRIKFNSIFTSQKLREILTKDKGEITNIYKNKTQITPSEWSVLYPDNGLPVSENFGLKLLIFLLLRYGHKSLTIPENKAVLQLETISHKVAESSNGNFNDHDFDKILEKIFKSIITLSGKYGERFRKICCFLCPENCKKLLDLEPDDAVFTYEVQIPAEKLD